VPDPIRVAVVNDYEIIVRGVAALLAAHPTRVEVVELDAGTEPRGRADVALFDTFAGRRDALARARRMVDDGLVDHVVLYTWDASSEFLELAAAVGVDGVVPKSQSGDGLVDAIERVVRGERVGLERASRGRHGLLPSALSDREQEVLALIALGCTNQEIGHELFLSVDTIKSHVRRLYSKLGVRNRTEAALLAAEHGVAPPLRRRSQAAAAPAPSR
jgi:DNA-binding NarL/FixJ family response regulator